MKNESRKIALCGMMVALGATVMMLGGVIPVMTFCSPAIAGLALLPVLSEYGVKWALAAWIAVTALALILSPDKESALLFAFLGYYPAAKPALDRIPCRFLRVPAKLVLFNTAAGAMMLAVVFVFNMTAVVSEYAEMTRAMLAGFVVLANITLLLYDRLLGIMMALYRKKLRRLVLKQANQADEV